MNKKIIILFVLIFTLSLCQAYAIDSSNWTSEKVGDIDFKIPPEYGNSTLMSDGYLTRENIFDFAIRDIDTFSFLKSSYGDDATSQNTYDIVNETVGGHTASVIYQEINVEDHNYNTIYVYFETDNHIYCVSFNDTEISPEIEEMISQTPNSEMDQDKFYGKLDKATENYLKQEQELYDDLIYDELSRNNEKQSDRRYYFFY